MCNSALAVPELPVIHRSRRTRSISFRGLGGGRSRKNADLTEGEEGLEGSTAERGMMLKLDKLTKPYRMQDLESPSGT